MGMDGEHQVLNCPFQFQRGHRFRDDFGGHRPNNVNAQNLPKFRVGVASVFRAKMPNGSVLCWRNSHQSRFAMPFRAGGYAPDQIGAFAAVVQKRIAELNEL